MSTRADLGSLEASGLIEIAALQRVAIHDPRVSEVAMTSPYLDHIRSTRKIIEAHHGTIDVQSEPGKGTKITIQLPAVAS